MSHISTNLSYLLRQLVPLYNIYAPNQRHLSEWSYAWVISHMIPSCPARMQYMTSVTVHHAYNITCIPLDANSTKCKIHAYHDARTHRSCTHAQDLCFKVSACMRYLIVVRPRDRS
jgi:hypothetical protein